jgi:hypothetical protein
VLPDGPGDSGELVGESDSGLVVAACGFASEGPGSESVWGSALGGMKDGASTMDEERSQVDVAASGDRAKAAPLTGGSLSGCEAEIAGEVSS